MALRVCTLTGNGLKDPGRAIAQIAVPPPVDADMGAVRDELGLSPGRPGRRVLAPPTEYAC